MKGPKKPLAPYARWQVKNRDRFTRKMAVGYSTKQLSQRLTQEWAKVPEAERKPFFDAHKRELAVYEKLMKAYKLTGRGSFALAEEKKKGGKQDKYPKDPNRPKKPQTAYFGFLAAKRVEVRDRFPSLGHKELISKLGEMWTSLSADEKLPYQKEAEKAKEAHAVEMAKYQKSKGYLKWVDGKEAFEEKRKRDAKAAAAESPAKEIVPSKKKQASVKKKQASAKKAPKRSATKAKKRGSKKVPVKAPKKAVKARVSKKKAVKSPKNAPKKKTSAPKKKGKMPTKPRKSPRKAAKRAAKRK